MVNWDMDHHLLEAGTDIVLGNSGRISRLEVFCYQGENKTLSSLFKSAELYLKINSDSFENYEANSSNLVWSQYNKEYWPSFSIWKKKKQKVHELDLYTRTCVGISTTEKYRVTMKVKRIDFVRFFCFCIGLVMFYTANLLAENAILEYIFGIILGIFAPLIITVYGLLYYIPKKFGAASTIITSWVLLFYIVKYFWKYGLNMIKLQPHICVVYIHVMILLSIIVLYNYKPMRIQWFARCIQWMIMGLASALVYKSSQYHKAIIAIIQIMIFYHNIYEWLEIKLRTYFYQLTSRRRKLISKEEYIEQGYTETRKALKELRKFCQSPECDTWNIISKVSRPQRLADFVDGGPHLQDDEIMLHRSEILLRSQDENEDKSLWNEYGI
ncbi:unnamed protein product [Meganyctiphanes norvegica]|uniref:Nuclear envelope integral membrane protein 1 n=1 Tax=Meganyctiphanes norvegica TaxID=48144 RepID=A0AAV2QN58_MEGNR